MRNRRNRKRRQQKRKIALGILAVLAVLLGAAGAWYRQEERQRGEDGEPQVHAETSGKGTAPSKGSAPEPETDPAEEICRGLSLEEKAAQMFIITPDALAGQEGVQSGSSGLKEAFARMPAGGFVLMGGNIHTPEQVTQLNRELTGYSEETLGILPFLCVDEEGGSVLRIASNENFPVEDVGSMSRIGASGDSARAEEAGAYIGGYLREYGFNVDFAPVADVLDNPSNTVVRDRSFGSDPEQAGEMAAAFIRGMKAQGVLASLKHFPGHGSTSEDSHEGLAYSMKTMDGLRESDLIPFRKGIEAGADFVMAGHIAYPNILDDDTPASMSGYFLEDVLRGEMGFDGLIITDAMNMGAVAENQDPGEAAVKAVEAGADLILMPADFESAYQAVLSAAEEGRISKERISRSAERIVRCKLEMEEKR